MLQSINIQKKKPNMKILSLFLVISKILMASGEEMKDVVSPDTPVPKKGGNDIGSNPGHKKKEVGECENPKKDVTECCNKTSDLTKEEVKETRID